MTKGPRAEITSEPMLPLTHAAAGGRASAPTRVDRPVIGVLPGEGIGPELTAHARRVLDAVANTSDIRVSIGTGGPIGIEARDAGGRELSEDVADFCDDIFRRGGAVLAGPGGGRFVYDLRKRFDLFCKFSPLTPHPELADAGCLRPQRVRDVDIMVVRDNIAGVYQGRSVDASNGDGPVVRHEFSYSDAQVRRLVAAGARVAATRRGHVTLVVKNGGLPRISALWTDAARDVCDEFGVELATVDVDHCAYRLVQQPDSFDVIVTPNLLGDILADLGAVLLASRGVSFSGNFSTEGHAVYQTNHGSAHDLVGADRANPAGHLFALAMMLRESFGLDREARLIEASIRRAWRDGFRTFDVATNEHRPVGTRAFVDRIVDTLAEPDRVAEAKPSVAS